MVKALVHARSFAEIRLSNVLYACMLDGIHNETETQVKMYVGDEDNKSSFLHSACQAPKAIQMHIQRQLYHILSQSCEEPNVAEKAKS